MAQLIFTESDTHFRLSNHFESFFFRRPKKESKELLHSRRSVLYTKGSLGAELDVGGLCLLVKVQVGALCSIFLTERGAWDSGEAKRRLNDEIIYAVLPSIACAHHLVRRYSKPILCHQI